MAKFKSIYKQQKQQRKRFKGIIKKIEKEKQEARGDDEEYFVERYHESLDIKYRSPYNGHQ